MLRLRELSLITVGAVLLALSVVISCSHTAPDADAAKTDQPLLDDGSRQSGSSAVVSEVRLSRTKPESKLISTAVAHSLEAHSFGDSGILPAGTLLTVRLEKALSAETPEAGEVFDAVVAEPVVIGGITVIPQGASVAGRIEAARASALKRSRACVRLTLSSIDVGGRDLAVQTSSLFARGHADTTSLLENASSVSSANSISLVNSVHLEKGRQLTFRLTGPVAVPSEQSVAAR
jgi:hypothetical protein